MLLANTLIIRFEYQIKTRIASHSKLIAWPGARETIEIPWFPWARASSALVALAGAYFGFLDFKSSLVTNIGLFPSPNF